MPRVRPRRFSNTDDLFFACRRKRRKERFAIIH